MLKVIALSVALYAVVTSADRRCTGVYFNEKYYNVNIIKDGLNNVHQLALNRNDNTLYFTFDQIAQVPTRMLGYLNMTSKEVGIIDGVRNATALAIDQTYNKVYIGGSEGIYRINNKRLERLPISDDVRSMFFKDVLYYINNRKEAFLFEDGYVNPLFELQGVSAEKLILDDDNNIFFTQGKNLFRVKLGTRAVNTHEKYMVDAIATDAFYRPYVSTNRGVYVYNKYKYVLDKVSDISNLKALTFNKANDPIYVIKDLIVKLNLNPLPCFED